MLIKVKYKINLSTTIVDTQQKKEKVSTISVDTINYLVSIKP